MRMPNSHAGHGSSEPASNRGGDRIAEIYQALQQGEAVEGPGHGAHLQMSVRAFTYEGHKVEIETMYTLRVDGREVMPHMSVAEDGRVACHALPAYSFVSAVDLVKQLIDTFPDDFRKRRR